ncbi:hypothetical protein O3P69_013195 [Scylla paramamosain]|uniref:Uncharacterized protein n=1 Tax=Scylla paramamosain TaxID=85552 RepID=A0AAW0U3N2_SCYPA
MLASRVSCQEHSLLTLSQGCGRQTGHCDKPEARPSNAHCLYHAGTCESVGVTRCPVVSVHSEESSCITCDTLVGASSRLGVVAKRSRMGRQDREAGWVMRERPMKRRGPGASHLLGPFGGLFEAEKSRQWRFEPGGTKGNQFVSSKG